MSSDIKTVLDEYIKLDDQLKIINKEATSLRSKRKLLSEQINDYMSSKVEGDSYSTPLGFGKNIFKVIKYTKKTVKMSSLEGVLKGKVKSDIELKSIMEELTDESEESYIKRTIKK